MNEYVMMDDSISTTMSMIDTFFNIFGILSFIGMGYGLYTLAKKMNIKNAWMGWVPLLQYYTMTQVAGVSFKKYVLYPLLAIIILGISGPIAIALLGENGMGIVMIIGILSLVAYLYYLIMYIRVLSATSKRTGRGAWTTVGLFLIPFIMYPVVAYKFKGLDTEKNEEKEEEIKAEL